MPKNIIYCWSGTGNSLFDAKGIAAGLEGETHILPMRGAAAKDADTVGFVFPTYYWTIPAPVEEFIREAELPGGAYYYAVATCGAIPGNALAELNALLEEKGLALSCHAVHLHVANYVTIYEPFPDPARRVPQAAERLVPIAADIAARRVMAPPRRRVPRFFQRFFHAATSWGDYGKSYDKGYHISEACVSCGLCERLCAVKNITMEQGRPVFHHNCEHCMACIQYCPQKAVNYKNATQKRSRYHHPSVPAAELEKLLNA